PASAPPPPAPRGPGAPPRSSGCSASSRGSPSGRGSPRGPCPGASSRCARSVAGPWAPPRRSRRAAPRLGLAPVVVKQIFEVLAQINRDGTTILLVEQNVARALGLAHRGYVLENGRIALSGLRDALLASGHIKQAYLGL